MFIGLSLLQQFNDFCFKILNLFNCALRNFLIYFRFFGCDFLSDRVGKTCDSCISSIFHSSIIKCYAKKQFIFRFKLFFLEIQFFNWALCNVLMTLDLILYLSMVFNSSFCPIFRLSSFFSCRLNGQFTFIILLWTRCEDKSEWHFGLCKKVEFNDWYLEELIIEGDTKIHQKSYSWMLIPLKFALRFELIEHLIN